MNQIQHVFVYTEPSSRSMPFTKPVPCGTGFMKNDMLSEDGSV
jgi:hypothetical protein